MPIYEYEPEGRECLLCEGRVQVLQSLDEEPLTFCPWCGLDVKRVISNVSFSIDRTPSPEAAAKKGFSVWKKSGKGTWEKIAAPDSDGPAPATESVLKVDGTEID